MLSFLRGSKNNGITITKFKNLMSILIQPEKSLVIGNRREPNILNLSTKIREPMKRRVIIILALLLSKSIWKWHWSKYDINFSDKVLFYSNHDEREVFCKLSTAIILSFWLERASISSHCWVVFNSFLSYTAIPLNIVTMYPMQKATSLPNNLTTLLLTLAISDVVVGLFAQSFYTFWSSGYNWITLLSCNVYQMLNISGIYF